MEKYAYSVVFFFQTHLSSGYCVESNAETVILDGKELGGDAQHLGPIEIRLGIGVLEIQPGKTRIHSINLEKMYCYQQLKGTVHTENRLNTKVQFVFVKQYRFFKVTYSKKDSWFHENIALCLRDFTIISKMRTKVRIKINTKMYLLFHGVDLVLQVGVIALQLFQCAFAVRKLGQLRRRSFHLSLESEEK